MQHKTVHRQDRRRLRRRCYAPVERGLGNEGIDNSWVVDFVCCIVWRLTTHAQRPGPRDARIATATRGPGSLQRMVRPRCVEAGCHKVENLDCTNR